MIILKLVFQNSKMNVCVTTVTTVQWSFGVTCWEVFTGGKQPYPGIHPLQVSELLESGQRMSIPANAACSKEM